MTLAVHQGGLLNQSVLYGSVVTAIDLAPGVTGDGSALTSQLPEVPCTPLPPLATLTKAQPSPLLRWQLLDVLFTYCLVARLFNGEHITECKVSRCFIVR